MEEVISLVDIENSVKEKIYLIRGKKVMLLTHKELKEKIDQLEKKYDGQFKVVFKALNGMLDTEKKEVKEKLGFRTTK
jgi:hypothetical protein